MAATVVANSVYADFSRLGNPRDVGWRYASRLGLGSLLLVAAVAKAGFGDGMSATALALAVAEVALAAWLFSGIQSRWAWRAAMLAFAAFSCVALWKARSGLSSCGCFGHVEVSPMVMFGIDALGLVLLAGLEATNSVRLRRGWRQLTESIGFGAAAVLAWVGILVAMQRGAAVLDASGRIVGAGSAVVLTPAEWVGHAFPLLDHLSLPADLSHGTWTVVLAHPDCPTCRELISRLERNAVGGAASATNLAVVSVAASTGAAEMRDSGPIVRGSLDPQFDWLVATPILITLRDGIVIAASSPDKPATTI